VCRLCHRGVERPKNYLANMPNGRPSLGVILRRRGRKNDEVREKRMRNRCAAWVVKKSNGDSKTSVAKDAIDDDKGGDKPRRN